MSDREDERLKRIGTIIMKETELFDAFKSLLAPLIKEVVLTTIEEQRQTQEQEQRQSLLEHSEATVTPDEAAAMLHTSKVSLWRWNKQGYLKPVKIGHKTFYRQSDIDALTKGMVEP